MLWRRPRKGRLMVRGSDPVERRLYGAARGGERGGHLAQELALPAVAGARVGRENRAKWHRSGSSMWPQLR